MPNRPETLEKLARKVRHLRDLERSLVSRANPRGTLDRLNQTRQELDELLDDLEKLDR